MTLLVAAVSRWGSCRLGRQRPVLDNLSGNVVEKFIDIAATLGWSFEVCQTMLFSKLLALLTGNNTVFQVNFVRYKDFSDPFTSVCLNLLEPVGDVVEGSLFSAIIYQYNPHGSFVICLCNSPKALLPCCVPYLQLHSLIFNRDGFDLEINS